MTKLFAPLFVLVTFSLAPLAYGLPPESCARTPQELVSSPALAAAVHSFGGVSNIFGQWKLGGFAGVIVKTHVDLKATRTAFSVVVNEDLPNDFWFCIDAQDPDVLKMRIQAPREPGNDLILLKVKTPGKAMMVASEKSKWKFMKFVRMNDDKVSGTDQ